MMALSAIEENGPVKLVSPEEIAAEDFFLPAAMIFWRNQFDRSVFFDGGQSHHFTNVGITATSCP
jgi:DUF917 family protein